MSDNNLWARAQELYVNGRFDEAQAVLRQVIAQHPSHRQALVMLGATLGRAGLYADAAALLERARDLDPGSADAWRGLGLVYRRHGRLAESVAAYERALALDPDDPETLVNAAVALKASGRLREAIAHLERAIDRQPRLSQAYLNLGNCLFASGDLDRAGAAFLQAVKLNPRDVPAVLGVAKVLREQRRFDLAEKTLQTAARLVPDSADIRASLGALQHDMGRSADALATLETVAASQPDNFLALRYLANVCRDLGRLAEADEYYRRALGITPDDADTLLDFAAVLAEQDKTAAALAVLRHVRDLHPDDVEVHYRRALLLLNEAELGEGWPEYAWRARTVDHRAVRFSHLPVLKDLRFAGRKVVIWGDQGIGDEVIYGSMLGDLRPYAADIVCEIDPRLRRLFERGCPEFTFVDRSVHPALPRQASDAEAVAAWRSAPLDDRFRGATHQIALPDLGKWLRPDVSRFPSRAAYLHPDPARVSAFRQWIDKPPGERVIGLTWVSRNKSFMRYKSLDLRSLVEALPDGVRLINLQYGDVEDEIAAVAKATARRVAVAPGLDYFNDIDGLAALIAACDAVVSVSNVTVHLAGAIGQRTALLCPAFHGKPWYWFRKRADSPWYPSVRLFRQELDGSWSRAIGACGAWVAALD